MTAHVDRNPFVYIVKKVDPTATLLSSWELKGGVSAQVTALEIQLAAA